jgi:hypothetical protein
MDECKAVLRIEESKKQDQFRPASKIAIRVIAIVVYQGYYSYYGYFGENNFMGDMI